MNESFGVSVAFMQLFLLALWEGLGGLYFGWSPLAIALVWVVGLWTLNIATASIVYVYTKLTRPPASENVVNISPVSGGEDVTEEGFIG